MVLEAEDRAKQRSKGKRTQSPTTNNPEEITATESAGNVQPPKKILPFTISLESLYALPQARSARVLHAAPVDPTSRLYPFCEMLRDTFLEAGFLQADIMKDNSQEKVDNAKLSAEEPSLLGAQTSNIPITQKTIPSRPNIRPLLLHATVVNTIYIRDRRQNEGHHQPKSRKSSQYTFDARDILSHYRDYYLDNERSIPRSTLIEASSHTDEVTSQGAGNNDATLSDDEINAPMKVKPEKAMHNPQNPFIWAKEFPLDTLCICEMGAKKLGLNGVKNEMDSRLGEKYTVVAKRRLDFSSSDQQHAMTLPQEG
ncbi:hypothetical protein FE257_009265 [Aspergillus nanangensis]|uniref:A-kinase anchor protein 7-like phosphoesterase domain-containing protein n=1 Tax=Aspergillus nanangensis TaxID=2582783 RepID=A0AAD4CKC5_ASPNN|nr:hypothetical protein FE257_009265 [Aspergillus nanangensis]